MNPCRRLCRPLPRLSATPPHAGAESLDQRPRFRADDGIRTRDPHLGKVMLYQLSHVRVAWRTLTDGPEPSKQGGPAPAGERRAPDRPRRSAARRVRPAVGEQHVQLVVEVEQRRSRCRSGTSVSVCRRNAATVARDSSNSASPEGARRCRKSTSVAACAGHSRTSPSPAGPVETGLQQFAAQQPGDPAVLEVDDAVLVTDVAEGDPDGERVRAVVAEQRRHLGPRLRADQLEGDGGGVPGGPSARHVRSTTDPVSR